jgi:hypothetical protein
VQCPSGEVVVVEGGPYIADEGEGQSFATGGTQGAGCVEEEVADGAKGRGQQAKKGMGEE